MPAQAARRTVHKRAVQAGEIFMKRSVFRAAAGLPEKQKVMVLYHTIGSGML